MSLENVKAVLGGEKAVKRSLRTRLDLIRWSSEGVSGAVLRRLSQYLDLPLKQFARLLPVSERTLQRYPPHKHFDRAVSEHILQIAELAARGTEVLGGREQFLQWAHLPNTALAGRTPFSLLDSRFGNEMVLELLVRMEHGVFS